MEKAAGVNNKELEIQARAWERERGRFEGEVEGLKVFVTFLFFFFRY